MTDLLIELFSEEIPARMQIRAANDLKKLVTDGMVEAGLTYASAAAFSTPRRLTLTSPQRSGLDVFFLRSSSDQHRFGSTWGMQAQY